MASYHILMLLVLPSLTHFTFGCETTCKIDLGFILDGSGSIGRSGLAQEIQFVKHISAMLDISKDQSRVSVMVFESYPKMVLYFKYGASKSTLTSYLSRILYRGGGTNTERALNLAASSMFQARYGARSGVRKVLVVFTDGRSSSGPRRVAAAAQRLKNMGVTIISIGVGRMVSRLELHSMATAPTQHHVFTVNSPNLLKTLESKVENELCGGVGVSLTGNLAKGKKSAQSSTGPWGGIASRGNDGNSNSHWNGRSCTATNKQVNPWWRVDLESEYDVAMVKIKNRYDCCWSRLRNVQIRVGNSPASPNANALCTSTMRSVGRGEMKVFKCLKPIKGRFVFVTILTNEILTLCEVEVYAAKTCPQPPSKECKLDIGFVLDSSGSIGYHGFRSELNFVKNIAKQLSLSEASTHVSVMTFASSAAVKIHFKDSSSKSQNLLEPAVNSIRYTGGGTNTEYALTLARSRMFHQSYGSRPGISKVLIVFTDGRSASGISRVKAAADKLKNMGINIISVGVGRRISISELHAMASTPTTQHMFRVPSANLLNSIVNKVKSVSCNAYTCQYAVCQYSNWSKWSKTCGVASRSRVVVKREMKTKQVVGGCAGLTTSCQSIQETKDLGSCQAICKLDIGFILDSSGSIGYHGFRSELNFVKNIAKQLSLSEASTHVSVMTFASSAAVKIHFKDSSSKSQNLLEPAVNSIRYTGGGTNTEYALILARSRMFHQSYGSRPGISKVLIVFTDGRSASGITRVKAAADKLKNMGINIISVGVGRRISISQLHAMASTPTAQHMFRVPSANLLNSIVSKVKSVSCNVYTCQYAVCSYGSWSKWTKTCGVAVRRRAVIKREIKTKKVVGGCAGLTTSCPNVQETKNLGSCLVKCNYVECSIGFWSSWSKTCGDAMRRRQVKTISKTKVASSCSSLRTSCADIKLSETRSTNCTCSYVECGISQWSAWSTPCGDGLRRRKTVPIDKRVERKSCDGLVQKCEVKIYQQTRKINCTCNTVECSMSPWSQWSATCGHATRHMGFVTRNITVKKESCDGLPTKCPDAQETMTRDEPLCGKKTSGATCPVKFKAVGCFKDNMKKPRPMPELILTERDRYHKSWNGKSIDWKNWNTYMMNVICRCAMKANSLKYGFFGLQFFGECWSGPEVGDTFRKDGVADSGRCIKQAFSPCAAGDEFCIGQKETNFVYQIA